MQTPGQPTPAAAKARRFHFHRELTLPSAWAHQQAVEVTGFVPNDTDQRDNTCAGRAALTFSGSQFMLSLRPTSVELIELASLLLAVADDNGAFSTIAQTASALPTAAAAALAGQLRNVASSLTIAADQIDNARSRRAAEQTLAGAGAPA